MLRFLLRGLVYPQAERKGREDTTRMVFFGYNYMLALFEKELGSCLTSNNFLLDSPTGLEAMMWDVACPACSNYGNGEDKRLTLLLNLNYL